MGGGGKTHRNLVDKGLQRIVYISPSWKLAREKQKEYGCHVNVWARDLAEDPEMWSGVDRYANVIVWDEVSQMWMETAKFALERFPGHKHIFCGDPGFQLPPIRQIGDDRQLTPFNTKDFVNDGGHVEHFNENRRCKCPVLERILKTLRSMIEQPDKFSAQSIGRWILRKFQEMGRVITIEEAVAKYIALFFDPRRPRGSADPRPDGTRMVGATQCQGRWRSARCPSAQAR